MPAIWRNRIQTGLLIAVSASALGLSSIAKADTTGQAPAPPVQMIWDATGDGVDPNTYDPNQFATTQTSFGTWDLVNQVGQHRTETGWRYRGGTNGIGNAWTLSWDCVVNQDPFVDATINVTNNTQATQTYTIFMPLPIVAVGPNAQLDGSVSASLSSQSFITPALLATNGIDSIYQASINGTVVKTLWDPGYSLAAAPLAAAGDTTNFANLIGPAVVANTIGVQLRFTLSAGDSASVTGIFNITNVPGPASLAVFGLFGLAGGRRRRS
jgi:MYXO-CTERM domain-containing protein